MIKDPSKKILRSPLRYPGGKGFFYQYFSELMIQNGLDGGKYFEPYAGGAGVALGLVSSKIASEAELNDADYHIFCFWESVLKENEHFIEKISNSILTIEEWKKQKNIFHEPQKYSVFEVGFSTFFLNRCNRSGILTRSGPIGGYKQEGNYKLNARFNKDNLMECIRRIGKLKNQISISNMDAILFLKKHIVKIPKQKPCFFFLDPPYISSGNRLYLNQYSVKDHKKLADFLIIQNNLNWIATYDNNLIIKNLYRSCQIHLFYLCYTLQSYHKGEELLIAPKWLKLPKRNDFSSSRWYFKNKIME